jgi:hypothetical protein
MECAVDSAAFFAHVREAPFGGKLLQTQVDGINALLSAWEAMGDDDANKLAYVLATTYHETAQTMEPISERGPVSYFAKYDAGTKLGKALGNTLPGDGFRYRGRGYVQLTGRANYAKDGPKVGADLVGNPDLALEPDIAAKIAVRGMLEGWFTGRKLGDYIHDGQADFINARRVINGTDRAMTIGFYANSFKAALAS